MEVAKARVNGQWLIQFRRELDETRRDEWDERQRYSFLRALTMYTGHLSVLFFEKYGKSCLSIKRVVSLKIAEIS